MRQDAAQQAYDRLMADQQANSYNSPHVETPEEVKRKRETLRIRTKSARNAQA